MNKNTFFKKIIFLSLITLVPASFAQKPDVIYGKSSSPRTDTVPVINVPPPANSNTSTNTNNSSCGAGLVYTNAYGCLPQGACPLGWALYNNTCISVANVNTNSGVDTNTSTNTNTLTSTSTATSTATSTDTNTSTTVVIPGKSGVVYGKSSKYRIVTVPVINVPPPTGTNTNTNNNTNVGSYPNTGTNTNVGSYPNTGTNTNVGPYPNTGTNTNVGPYPNTGTNTNSNTDIGVHGTSTTPTTLGNTSQVGSVNQGPGSSGKGHGGKRLKAPSPGVYSSTVIPAPVVALGGNTAVLSTSIASTSTNTNSNTNSVANINTNTNTNTSTNTSTSASKLVIPVSAVNGVSTSTSTVPNSTMSANTSTNTSTNTNTSTSTATATATSNSTSGVPVTAVNGVSAATNPKNLEVGGVQTSKKDILASKPSCEDEALKEIYRIMTADQNNAFAKMYELTIMKLAKKALAEGNVTIEGFTRNKISELESQLNGVKGSVDVQNQVKAAYEAYGKSSDQNTVNNDMDRALASGKRACAWSMSTRLWNDQVSSYVLAASTMDKNSGLTDADAAIVWAVDKVREGAGPNYKHGTANGNLMSVSNRIARYLGVMQGGKSLSKEDLDQKIADQVQELVGLTSQAYAAVKTSLFACIDQANPSCPDCAHKQKEKFETDYLGLANIQRGLAAAVAKSDNSKMERFLKGKAGNINFDFGKTLAKGTVTIAPERMNKFDACGKPKQKVTPEVNETAPSETTSEGSANGQVSIAPASKKGTDFGLQPEPFRAVKDKTFVAPPVIYPPAIK